jgi:hypothetical protein
MDIELYDMDIISNKVIRRAAVLPGGQRQYAGGYSYSSHRGMSGYGGNMQICVYILYIYIYIIYICYILHVYI